MTQAQQVKYSLWTTSNVLESSGVKLHPCLFCPSSFMVLSSVGPARLRSEVRHLQFRYCGLWVGQWQGSLPGHAAHSGKKTKTKHNTSNQTRLCLYLAVWFESVCSDAASEAARLPLLPARCGAIPTWRAGGAEGVAVRGGLWHRGECGHREPVAQRHRSSHRPTSEPWT